MVGVENMLNFANNRMCSLERQMASLTVNHEPWLAEHGPVNFEDDTYWGHDDTLVEPTGLSSTFVHWQDGYKNTRAKEKYSRATLNMTKALYATIPPARQDTSGLMSLEEFNSFEPTPQDIRKALVSCGYAFPTGSLFEEEIGPTESPIGKWFTLSLSPSTLASIMKDAQAGSADWQLAVHGTSMPCANRICRFGLRVGPSKSAGKAGVYVEGWDRRSSAMNYMTHIAIPGVHPGWVMACMFTTLVDRKRGSTVRRQWCQHPDSVLLTHLHVHVLHLKDLLGQERGAYRVYRRNHKELMDKKIEFWQPDGTSDDHDPQGAIARSMLPWPEHMFVAG
jgi:hypothetical protein